MSQTGNAADRGAFRRFFEEIKVDPDLIPDTVSKFIKARIHFERDLLRTIDKSDLEQIGISFTGVRLTILQGIRNLVDVRRFFDEEEEQDKETPSCCNDEEVHSSILDECVEESSFSSAIDDDVDQRRTREDIDVFNHGTNQARNFRLSSSAGEFSSPRHKVHSQVVVPSSEERKPSCIQRVSSSSPSTQANSSKEVRVKRQINAGTNSPELVPKDSSNCTKPDVRNRFGLKKVKVAVEVASEDSRRTLQAEPSIATDSQDVRISSDQHAFKDERSPGKLQKTINVNHVKQCDFGRRNGQSVASNKSQFINQDSVTSSTSTGNPSLPAVSSPASPSPSPPIRPRFGPKHNLPDRSQNSNSPKKLINSSPPLADSNSNQHQLPNRKQSASPNKLGNPVFSSSKIQLAQNVAGSRDIESESPTPKNVQSTYFSRHSSPSGEQKALCIVGHKMMKKSVVKLGEKDGELFEKNKVKFIDSHCHFTWTMKRLDCIDIDELTRRFPELFLPPVSACIQVFCHPDEFSQFEAWDERLYRKNGLSIFYSIGCHPNFVDQWVERTREVFIRTLDAAKRTGRLVALGETGLDYHHCTLPKVQLKQRTIFREQLLIAVKRSLPLIIHCRNGENQEAENDCFTVMQEARVPRNHPVHRHCYEGDTENVRRWMSEYSNMMFGFTPVQGRRPEVREAIKRIPLDKILLETDAPYFTPSDVIGLPYANTRYERRVGIPGALAFKVAREISELKELTLETVLQATRDNTCRLYKISADMMIKGS